MESENMSDEFNGINPDSTKDFRIPDNTKGFRISDVDKRRIEGFFLNSMVEDGGVSHFKQQVGVDSLKQLLNFEDGINKKCSFDYKLHLSNFNRLLYRDEKFDVSFPELMHTPFAPKKHFSEGLDHRIQYFEENISEFDDEELVRRELYHERCNNINGLVGKQISREAQSRRISGGVRRLLEVALDYISSNRDRLATYEKNGVDIDSSLLELLSLPRAKGNTFSTNVTIINGIDLAAEYLRWLSTGEESEGVQHHLEYAAQQAQRVIRAFMSIAEYERFRGDSRKYKILEDKNKISGTLAVARKRLCYR